MFYGKLFFFLKIEEKNGKIKIQIPTEYFFVFFLLFSEKNQNLKPKRPIISPIFLFSAEKVTLQRG